MLFKSKPRKLGLSNHGAVVVFASATFSCREPFSELKHPSSVEEGDWYSTEPVSSADIDQIITGQVVVDWLDPHAMDFEYCYRCILRERSLRQSSLR